MTSPHISLLALLGTCLLAMAYWSGLHGPLLLDDFENLAPLSRYLAHQLSAAGVIFGNHSGTLGRPLSMASFVLDARLWGGETFGFKLTNLLLHLGNAGLVWLLLTRLLGRDPSLARFAWLPAWLAFVWAVFPIEVSTVLYVVQRMAILSALLTLLALLAYVRGRELMEAGQGKRGLAWIWLLFPALILLATLAKENGVLAIPFAALIEYVWFGRAVKRPAAVTGLFIATLALPLLGCIALFAFDPGRLLSGYIGRDFTLYQRVLTEPRILWDYVATIVVPNGPRLGLFHDNYMHSTGLFTPISTACAIAAWLLVAVMAWAVRRRAPAVTFGAGFFLAAHALESSVFPLELYFEHRNYLASLGILVAIVGLGDQLARRLPPPTRFMRIASTGLLFLVPTTYLAATFARAQVWSSDTTLYAQEEAHNGDSPRLNGILAARAMERGDLASALRHIAVAERSGPRDELGTATTRRLLAYCVTTQPIPERLYREAEAGTARPLTQYGMVAWELLAQRVESGVCVADKDRLARIGAAWATHGVASPLAHAAWRTRYNSARLLASAGQMDAAAALSARAYADSDHNFGVGVLAFQTCASSGNIHRCADIAYALQRTANPQDQQAIMAAAAFVKASSPDPVK
jgi:hypothetical protein